MTPDLVIAIPTCPRLRDGVPAGYLTRTLTTLNRALRMDPFLLVEVLIMDCSAPGDIHEELNAVMADGMAPPTSQVFKRQGPFVPPSKAPTKSIAYQQSLDFIELMEKAYAFGSPWILRIEDDGLCSEPFASRMIRFASRYPHCPLFSLFSIRLRFDGQTTPHYTGAVALLFPTQKIPLSLATVRSVLNDTPFDVALGNLDALALFPSFFQHIGQVSSSGVLYSHNMETSPTFRPRHTILARLQSQFRVAALMAREGVRRYLIRPVTGKK